MKLIWVSKLKGNEILAMPVLSSSEIVLMSDGTVMKKEYIEKLIELGVESVYVYEDEEVAKAEKTLNGETDADEIEQPKVYKIEETKEQSKEIVKSVLERHIYKHNSDLHVIADTAEKILDSVLSEPEVIDNITEIRNISTDMYTHCINVCALSTIMALRLKMNEKQVRNVSMGAILHDIGLRYISVPYINIDSTDLNDKDELEYKKHTVYGYSSVQEEKWLSDTSKEIILFHHEREDGSGYPFHQNGNHIKPEIKLVSVCDDFDSFISGIGSKKMKIYEAIEYIKVNTGTIYDATVAEKLLESVALYPVGIEVITNEGETGVVIKQNEITDRPILKMLKYADGSDYKKEVIKDLMKILTLFIVDTVE